MQQEHPTVEIDSVQANSASLGLNTFANELQRKDIPLGDALSQFAETYGEMRVEADEGDTEGTIVLTLSPEGYRTIAAALRMNALNRNARAEDRDLDGFMGVMANDDRELARVFDRAAKEAEADQ